MVKQGGEESDPGESRALERGAKTGSSESRRLKMKDSGSEIDAAARLFDAARSGRRRRGADRSADQGLLRLDRDDGRPLAVLYNFACHPIMNPPSKGNSADFPGFASIIIEEALGEEGWRFFRCRVAGETSIRSVTKRRVISPTQSHWETCSG